MYDLQPIENMLTRKFLFKFNHVINTVKPRPFAVKPRPFTVKPRLLTVKPRPFIPAQTNPESGSWQ